MSAASADRPAPPLTRRTRIVVSEAQVSAELQGETVILSMSDGVYFGLDRVGTRIWQQLATPRSLGDVLETVLHEFEVDRERAWADLVRLVTDLLSSGLVRRAADDGG
jgi:hypothetical protein